MSRRGWMSEAGKKQHRAAAACSGRHPRPARRQLSPTWNPWPATSRSCCRRPSSWSAVRERPSMVMRPCARIAVQAPPTGGRSDPPRLLARRTAGGQCTMNWRSAGESQSCPDSASPQGPLPSGLPSPAIPVASKVGLALPSRPLPHRRAQLKRCLERLKQQMPLGADCARYTTLSLLRRARMHIQKLEDQEQRARQLKERLRSKQQSLQRQLEQLRGLAGAAERERLRADSLDSSGLSSERSDSDQEELEVDVESLVFGGEAELLRGFVAGQEHSYSHGGGAWL
ncbi:max dimerization protein 3 isoform X1 [Pan troglodytes]|uniref:max dimerization protein 3 isoform X1 n=1 Tax=Pan troglodytes TaxID=9598 RepID=UPI0007DBDE93|nr:max dimerization protein 3 isoform X1 [Pan troglodytes]